MSEYIFVVRGERFRLSHAALGRLGSACMLTQAISEASADGDGNHVIAWPEPLTLTAFALIMEWAERESIRPIGPEEAGEAFRAADALNLPDLCRLCLSAGPPPSCYADNASLLAIEAPYHVELAPQTFVARRGIVGRALPLDSMPVLYPKEARDRTGCPLFNAPDALRNKLEEMLPTEARICLGEGLCLAGGFAGRAAACLAGLCTIEPPPIGGTAAAQTARPDIDFFVTSGDPAEALRIVRSTLIALARHCEETQVGMFVVRSPYALTIAMDDCLVSSSPAVTAAARDCCCA